MQECTFKRTKKSDDEVLQEQIQNKLSKWKSLKEEEVQEDRSLSKAKINNKIITSQKKLAEEYADSFLKKLETIKEDLPSNNIVAEKVFKLLIPRNNNDIKIKEVPIKEVYKTIE